MDTLSRLLALYPVRVILDYRCQLRAPWRLDEPALPFGTAPYHLIAEGDAWLDIPNGESIELQAGDIVVLPHGSAHCLRTRESAPAQTLRAAPDRQFVRQIVNDGTGPGTCVVCGRFVMDADASHALLNALPPLILIRSADKPEFAGMKNLIAMLRDETEAIQPGSATIAAHLASAFFSLVIRAWLERAESVPGVFSLLAERRLHAALRCMLAEPGRNWTVETLAAACHLSRASFARLFRQSAGSTPGALLTRLRLAQAAQWLLQDARSIPAIAEAVGYRSEAAFNRIFKRHFGIGPGRYRRMRA